MGNRERRMEDIITSTPDHLQGIICPQVGAPLQVNFTPRQYQLELLEASLKRNSVICLQSGSAKDFIAIMLIKELSKDVRKSCSNRQMFTVFVVNSAQLVYQQANVIKTHTNLKVAEYVGELGAEAEAQKFWEKKRESCQVVVLTCRVFLHLLLGNVMKLSTINAVIFDECHHACEEHPYHDIMSVFDRCCPDEHPHILGLTSSLLVGKFLPSALERTLNDLECTLKSHIETAINVQSVSRYGTKPQEIVIECEPYDDLTLCCNELMDILHETLWNLERYRPDTTVEEDPTLLPRQAIGEAISALRGIGPLGIKLMVQLLLSEIDKFEKHTTLPFDKLLFAYTCSQLRYVRKKCSLECGLHLRDGESIWSLRLVTPKFRKLINVLQSFRPQMDPEGVCNKDEDRVKVASTEEPAAELNVCEEEEEDDSADDDDEEEEDRKARSKDSSLCGIVFAEGRFVAFVLDTLLRKFQKSNPDLGFISSCSIMGHETTGLGKMQTQAQAKRQEQMLRRFRRHETHLLFATNILEEGVDVPRCNLVVRFDPPMQYRSYIQSKARARAHSSFFIMLVDSDKKDRFTQDLKDYREIDEILQHKCHFREADVGNQVDVEEVDRLLPPLMPRKEEGAAKVTMSGAITLVNRYCAKLPSDSFTHLTPTWQISSAKVDDGVEEESYRCTLHLPINSPLRDPITGCEMPTKKMAKMSAALRTCERLYQVGELNDQLLPVGKETILEEYDIEGEMEDNIDNEGRPGTIQRRQYYEKAIAECLVDTLPSADILCYLYVISMALSVPLPAVLNVRERKLHDPKATPRCFGILTSKTIPKVPSFPVYTRDGELAVSVHLVTSEMRLTSCELDQAKAFHQCIFSDVLRLQKPNILYGPETDSQTDKSTYVIIPLNNDNKAEDSPLIIDWPFLKKVSDCARALDHPPSLPNYTKQEFIFDSELYEDAVVTPIYRNIDQPQRYFVAEILHDTLVTSPFPSDKYAKYVDYFFERYEIEISNFRQPLLDVDCMSSRLNLLTPRYLNHKGKVLPIGSKQAKKSNAQKKQYLVPELCYIYPIPASMWRKAICLPSVLYRLNSLLVAEELRVILAKEAAIGSVQVPVSYPYEALSFGWQGLATLESKQRLSAIKNMCNQEFEIKKQNVIHSVPMSSANTDNKFNMLNDVNKLTAAHGPSPSMLLQALTMSNASDGFNLERLEMLGDSFLKQAVTVFLYCHYHSLHEGKLSFLRSKQVSNYNLYRLGKRKGLAHWMQVCLFDPAINWLPPGYVVRENQTNTFCVPPEQVDEYISDDDDDEEAADFDIGTWEPTAEDADYSSDSPQMSPPSSPLMVIHSFNPDMADFDSDLSDDDWLMDEPNIECKNQLQWSFAVGDPEDVPGLTFTGSPKVNHSVFLPELPYEIHTQQSLSDKSVADCVESLIGCCLVSCGFRSALLFLCWIGLTVLPKMSPSHDESAEKDATEQYGYLPQPSSPLFTTVPEANLQLHELLDKFGHKEFEATIGYTFRDKAYLLQALCHASYHLNQVTDCYQRLEFLGDALLDYLITKHLYDHYRNLSPGALTDLRSALVNNTIFASLAVKYGFHQFFLYLSPDLFKVIGNFVTYMKEKNEALGMESELKLVGISDTDEEQEDIEVPKALGDIFESIAGAVYLDSGMSMDAVWTVYYPMMIQQIEQYAANLPISPVRELLEMEPETAKFGPPERTMDGKTRVTVNVVGKGQFKGVGRNYRIAKATAARCALRHLRK